MIASFDLRDVAWAVAGGLLLWLGLELLERLAGELITTLVAFVLCVTVVSYTVISIRRSWRKTR